MRRLLSLLLLLILVAPSGCWFVAGAAAAGATIYYIQGEAKKLYPTSLEKTHAATVEALKSLKLVITEQKDTDEGKYIQAVREDSTKVSVNVVRVGEAAEVRIRVGLTGDETYSRRIFDEIDKRI